MSGLSTVVGGATLTLNATLQTTQKTDLFNCSYQAISWLTDDKSGFSSPQPFTNTVKIGAVTDAVKVTCLISRREETQPVINSYKNVHYVMMEKPKIEEKLLEHMRQREQRSTSHREQKRLGTVIPSYMNVLIVGVDSVSRFNMIRTMQRMRNVLLNKLQAVDFVNYTKVGDSTLPNVFALLTGRSIAEAGYDSKRFADRQGLRFLWQDFQHEGYRTILAEDITSGNIFRFAQSGFAQPPTHYYPPTVEIAKEYSKDLWSHDERCFMGQANENLLLDNIVEFARLFRHKPHFAFTWLTRSTHDELNGGSRVDVYFEKFLSQLLQENLLNNTLLAIMSDHGFRYGRYRATPVGKFEEKRPFLYLAFPPWFRKAYPTLMERVKQNADRMTTHLDFHNTLLDVLYLNNKDTFSQRNVSKHGISFFDQIPRNRTCVDAGIPLPFCVCLSEQALPASLPIAQQAGAALVASLNAAMSKATDLCHNLTLAQVRRFVLVGEGDSYLDRFCTGKGTVRKSSQIVRVTVVAKPSDAVFEGTLIKCGNSIFQREDDVLRINRYGKTSHCVNEPFLKKWCFCKDQLQRTPRPNRGPRTV